MPFKANTGRELPTGRAPDFGHRRSPNLLAPGARRQIPILSCDCPRCKYEPSKYAYHPGSHEARGSQVVKDLNVEACANKS